MIAEQPPGRAAGQAQPQRDGNLAAGDIDHITGIYIACSKTEDMAICRDPRGHSAETDRLFSGNMIADQWGAFSLRHPECAQPLPKAGMNDRCRVPWLSSCLPPELQWRNHYRKFRRQSERPVISAL